MKDLIKDIAKRGLKYCGYNPIELAERITDQDVDPVQVAAVLMEMRMEGYSVDDIVGFAKFGRQCTHILNPKNKREVVDIVGTGGDCTNTFNISTAAAFVVAGAGVPVAKYGNKAVSSSSGSSDVLDALGINIYQDFEKIEKCLEETGLVFMNAQQFNPAFKTVASVRKSLGIPTIFNVIGPLTNPVQPRYIAMGVYSCTLHKKVAEAAKELGYERGLFFHGYGADDPGLDEITIGNHSGIFELNNGKITDYCINLGMFNMEYGSLEDLQVKDKEESATVISGVLERKIGSHKRNVVLLNAAAGLYAAGKVPDFKEGVELAKESIDSGKALEKLCAVREYMK